MIIKKNGGCMKKYLILLLLIIITVGSSSCADDLLDKSLRGQIETVWGDDAPDYIIYQGEKYYYEAINSSFIVGDYEYYKEDVLLSWDKYYFLFSRYTDRYYSYSNDSPLFIYQYEESRMWLYFHEDYNCMEDTFIVGDTDSEIVLGDIFGSKVEDLEDVYPAKSMRLSLQSKTNSRLRLVVNLYYSQSKWYISYYRDIYDEMWEASESFVKILEQNGKI